jgi:hypothetical protein
MLNVRRWYIYLVCAISLQGVVWAVIALLRNLFIYGVDPIAVAFQIAVVIVGLPVYLAHWLWGQRLVQSEDEERGAVLRRFYLYGMMAAFLGPFMANAFDLIRRMLGGLSQFQSYGYQQLSFGEAILIHVLAMIVLAPMWFYHQRTLTEDSRIIPEIGGSATVRRLYVLGFSATGLILTTMATIHLIRWVMLQFGMPILSSVLRVGLTDEITRLIIGVPLWVIFWRWAGKLYSGPNEDERASALRKFYLYGAVFIGAMTAVANATGLLAGVFRRALSLPPEGGMGFYQPLPVIIGMGVLWAYHALVLRNDAKQILEVPRQAGVRSLYLYLIAAIGLSALLIGLSGNISVIIQALGEGFGTSLRVEFSWFTAAIIAGLPVWIIPWRQAQIEAEEKSPAGEYARRFVVRKIYLYFYLFVASMTVLSSTVYIVFRILSSVLGGEILEVTELGQAISFSLIAAGVWFYHGRILQGDRRISQIEKVDNLKALKMSIVDIYDGSFGQALVDDLKRDIPDFTLEPIVLHSEVLTGEDKGEGKDAAIAELAEAGLIVGPWVITVPGGGEGAVTADIAHAVVTSSARKLLIPVQVEGWDWAGVERWKADDLLRQTVQAVKQIAAGEIVKVLRPMGAGTIIAIVIGVFFLLILLAIPLLMYFGF